MPESGGVTQHVQYEIGGLAPVGEDARGLTSVLEGEEQHVMPFFQLPYLELYADGPKSMRGGRYAESRKRCA